VDIRSDIYSLGISLYEMLCGSPPFDGDPLSVMYAHVSRPLPRHFASDRSLPDAVKAIVARMTAKRPEDRFQTPDELIQAIETILPTLPAEPGAADAPHPNQACSSPMEQTDQVRPAPDTGVLPPPRKEG